MKPNVIGIVGGIIAFISLLLPWWTINLSVGAIISLSFSIYPYQVTRSMGGALIAATVDIWYGGTALALVVLGGFLGIVASLLRKRAVLIIGGLFVLLAVIVFAVGQQSELSNGTFISGMSAIGLFSNGTVTIGIDEWSCNAYLSFGFWLALASAILILVASTRKPVVTAPPPPMPTLEKAAPEKEAGTSATQAMVE